MKISLNLSNAIRFLSIDSVQKANSGHPGMPMGMADIATVLWRKHLSHNPKNPKWINRDRFVLSDGHGSMLLYSLLHLTGYDVSIKDLKDFRQLHSRTPGHPEYSYTPGVETTTGPLGQGLANAVGMALAEKNRRKHIFNKIMTHTKTKTTIYETLPKTWNNNNTEPQNNVNIFKKRYKDSCFREYSLIKCTKKKCFPCGTA